MNTPTPRPAWFELAAVLCIGCVPDVYHSQLVLLHGKPPTETFGQTMCFIALRAVWVVVPVLFVLRQGPTPLEHFGLVRPRWQDAFVGVVAFGVHLAAMDAAWQFVRHLRGFSPAFEGVGAQPGSLFDLGILLGASLANGIAEELVVRAYLITRLRPLLGTAPALLVSAIVFASYHGYQGLHAMLLHVVGGVVLGLAFLATKRLAPLALAHAALDVRAFLAIG